MGVQLSLLPCEIKFDLSFLVFFLHNEKFPQSTRKVSKMQFSSVKTIKLSD